MARSSSLALALLSFLAASARADDVIVPKPDEDPDLRLRSHSDGPLTVGSPRRWVGIDVPQFVPRELGTRDLLLLDAVPDGYLAVYREPYGAGACDLDAPRNCPVSVTLHGTDGQVRWTVDLGPVFSRPEHLEVQDVRWDQGTLYFNEACQSYSKGARGRCSSLVAFDPVAGAVRWRTGPLVSNHWIMVLGDVLVVGYGFTAEPDFLRVVRRSDGKVLSKLKLRSAASGMWLEGTPDAPVLRVSPGGGKDLRFKVPTAARPALIRTGPPARTLR